MHHARRAQAGAIAVLAPKVVARRSAAPAAPDGGALVETVASYATPSGEEINLKGVKPDEDHIFISDVLGSSYVDADVKAAAPALRQAAE